MSGSRLRRTTTITGAIPILLLAVIGFTSRGAPGAASPSPTRLVVGLVLALVLSRDYSAWTGHGVFVHHHH
jgi:hypothetical protein